MGLEASAQASEEQEAPSSTWADIKGLGAFMERMAPTALELAVGLCSWQARKVKDWFRARRRGA